MKSRHKLGLALLLAFLFLVLLLSSLSLRQHGVKNELLKTTILKTGKSDAIVLQSEGHTILLDAAESDDAKKVIGFLQESQITTVDYLIITHFDKDHIGTAPKILETFQVQHVLLPDYQGSIAEYADLMTALDNFGITPEYVTNSTELSFGTAQIRIDPPLVTDVEYLSKTVEDFDNTLSLISTVTCGEKKLLLTGDADRRRLEEWLETAQVEDCDFLKVPHHGKFNSALENLIEAVHPQYAGITCSKKNPANDSTIDLLKQYGVDIYQTIDGNITVVTDGSRMDVRVG